MFGLFAGNAAKGVDKRTTEIYNGVNDTLYKYGQNSEANLNYRYDQGAAELGNRAYWGQNNLRSGADTANYTLGNAAQMYGSGREAYQLLGDSYGVNGPQGNQRAYQAFRSSPGYEFAMDQGIDALSRAASKGGMLASGNTLAAATRYGQNLADQGYSQWQQGLSGLGMDANRQTTALMGQQAQNQYKLGQDTSGIDMQAGLASLGSRGQQGNVLAGIWQNVGNQQNQLAQWAGGQKNSADMKAAAAREAGLANMFNLGDALWSRLPG